MTVVVYDPIRKQVATDTMTTLKTRGSVTSFEGSSKVIDLSQVTIAVPARKPKTREWTEFRPLAACFAGDVACRDDFLQLVLQYFYSTEILNKSALAGLLQLNRFTDSSLLIIGHDVSYMATCPNSKTLRITALSDRTTTAIGSGSGTAYTAIDVFGVDVGDAVLAAGRVSSGCGNGALIFNVTPDGLKFAEQRFDDGSRNFLSQLRDRSARSEYFDGLENVGRDVGSAGMMRTSLDYESIDEEFAAARDRHIEVREKSLAAAAGTPPTAVVPAAIAKPKKSAKKKPKPEKE